jgi:peptidyl-prolyl cis-trans isomerase C
MNNLRRVILTRYQNISRSIGGPIFAQKCIWSVVIVTVFAAGVSACGNKDKTGGQTIARVDGLDITILQLNDELRRANVPPSQVDAARKQLLESLINRQLLVEEAIRNRLDRSPNVLQEIERAKAQIIAQAYVDNLQAKIKSPSQELINDYFQKHAELFLHRKQYDMRSLAVRSEEMTDELKSIIASAKSFDDVATWLTKHDVPFKEGHALRESSEFPDEMAVRLGLMPRGSLFVVNEAGSSMIVAIADIKEIPISLKEAEPEIVQRLTELNKKEALDKELKQLRSVAKIEYVGALAQTPEPSSSTARPPR